MSCYLPLFDRVALTSIKEELEGAGKGEGIEVGPQVVRKPQVFERNPQLDADVFDLVERLPSIPTPDRSANPLRRAKKLVQLLSDDGVGRPLLRDADARLTERLNKRMDGLAAEFATEVAVHVEGLRTVDMRRESVTASGGDPGVGHRSVETHVRDLDCDGSAIVRRSKRVWGSATTARPPCRSSSG